MTLKCSDVLNALNQELRNGLQDALLDFRDDPSMLVAIMLDGGEGTFSAGMDLIEGPRALAEKGKPVWKET